MHARIFLKFPHELIGGSPKIIKYSIRIAENIYNCYVGPT